MSQPTNPPEPTWGAPKAQHQAHGGTDTVVFDNLKVLIIHDQTAWFAQGLDIDYFAQGNSLQEVMAVFQDGLTRTFVEHVKDNGSINLMVKPAPQEYWQQFFEKASEGKLCCSLSGQVVFQIPKKEIVYPIKYLCPEDFLAAATA